jgi:asparagine synthase (glutamine-hydrolysing)
MCGISGYLQKGGFEPETAGNIVNTMAAKMIHRGPDDSGVWVDGKAGIALAHRRLAVVDLSAAGHQPMVSKSGRYVIVYNGEIYNHLALRKELESQGKATSWNGHSDTETLLACFEANGIEATLKSLVGMFALALWDKKQNILTLARDRMGEKPLYYGRQNNVFLFGSELKAIKAHPAFKNKIHVDSLTLFLRYNYVPSPYSIYEGIYKLTPASYIQISDPVNHSGAKEIPEPVSYWSLGEVAEAGQKDPFSGSDEDAISSLESCLKESVGLQMTADVPLGAFLSGGVDSSTIAALMQAQSSRPVKTFTIGFHEKSFNEAVYAREVAKHLGTEHTGLYVTAKEAMEVIPGLPTMYDEPFSDPSQVPTFLVSKLTRQHVTVSLSGDAGDELFGGYNRYFVMHRLLKTFKKIPAPARKAIGYSLMSTPSAFWRFAGGILFSKVSEPAEKIRKLSEILTANDPEAMYRQLISHWQKPHDIVINGNEPPVFVTDKKSKVELKDFESTMMYLDSMSYLPDDILVKVDRAAMAVSLETRVPLLDHRVVEFASKLPLHMKIRNGQGKWILRQVLYKYVPKELIERPKMGFGVPIDSWLRQPLRDWAEELLSENRLKREGFFNPEPIRKKWREHLSGRRNWHYHLWDILMFQAWLNENPA